MWEPFSLQGLRGISERVMCHRFDDTHGGLSTWQHKKELQQTKTRHQICAQDGVQLGPHTETDKDCHLMSAHQFPSPHRI